MPAEYAWASVGSSRTVVRSHPTAFAAAFIPSWAICVVGRLRTRKCTDFPAAGLAGNGWETLIFPESAWNFVSLVADSSAHFLASEEPPDPAVAGSSEAPQPAALTANASTAAMAKVRRIMRLSFMDFLTRDRVD